MLSNPLSFFLFSRLTLFALLLCFLDILYSSPYLSYSMSFSCILHPFPSQIRPRSHISSSYLILFLSVPMLPIPFCVEFVATLPLFVPSPPPRATHVLSPPPPQSSGAQRRAVPSVGGNARTDTDTPEEEPWPSSGAVPQLPMKALPGSRAITQIALTEKSLNHPTFIIFPGRKRLFARLATASSPRAAQLKPPPLADRTSAPEMSILPKLQTDAARPL